ncbi:MAG: PAS domain S-box protein [Promethearchaeota archaeon]
MDFPKDRFIQVIEGLEECYFEVDLKGTFLYVNEALCKTIGHSRDQILGLNYKFITTEENRKKIFEGFNTIYRTGEPLTDFEYQFKNNEGQEIIGETSVYLKYDSNGKKVGFYGIFRDVTKRRKREEHFKQELEQLVKLRTQELIESEEKYRNMINHLDLGFYQLNWEGLIINHNPRFCEILGYSRSENLINRDVHDFWQTPEDRKVYLEELNKHGFVKNYLVHAKSKNGEKIVVQLNSHIIEGPKGKPKLIQGLISDITEKFELEQKLKESEERYRNLIESVPFSIALINQKGVLVYINPVIEKLLGYRQDELIGIEFKNLPALSPKYIPTMLKRFQQVLKGEVLPPLEIELIKKDGSSIWIKYQSSLVKLGKEVLLQTVINDINEQKKADLLVEEEILKLKELDQLRKDLISRVSHELKTPLVSVCGATELLLDSFIDQFKDEARELIEMIEKGGKRLKYLVDNLVDITRIEYKNFKLDKSKQDINQIIRDCVRELMYLVKMRDLILDLDLKQEIFLKIDKVRIEQVILNLLSNAIKNTPPHGRITIKSFKVNNSVKVSITDTGIGLTKEEMEKLFIRFGKIERYGDGLEYVDIQGTGLGLYISKEIIDLHEGQIWVESMGRNKGCTFNIKIPIN